MNDSYSSPLTGRFSSLTHTTELSSFFELPEPPAWVGDALCAQTDPEMFFPEKGGSTYEAKKICRSCDVKAECLAYALANDERYGIWGGHSPRELIRLARGEVIVSQAARRRQRIVDLRAEGLTQAAIAERLGVSEGHVRRALGVSE